MGILLSLWVMRNKTAIYDTIVTNRSNLQNQRRQKNVGRKNLSKNIHLVQKGNRLLRNIFVRAHLNVFCKAGRKIHFVHRLRDASDAFFAHGGRFRLEADKAFRRAWKHRLPQSSRSARTLPYARSALLFYKHDYHKRRRAPYVCSVRGCPSFKNERFSSIIYRCASDSCGESRKHDYSDRESAEHISVLKNAARHSPVYENPFSVHIAFPCASDSFNSDNKERKNPD